MAYSLQNLYVVLQLFQALNSQFKVVKMPAHAMARAGNKEGSPKQDVNLMDCRMLCRELQRMGHFLPASEYYYLFPFPCT